MAFDTDNARRRKASLVSSADGKPALQDLQDRQDLKDRQETSCFVHSLLEKHRNAGRKKSLGPIDEHRKQDKATNDDGYNDGAATHSRLLTKKQLSDMAWKIRDLSKKLGSVRLKMDVHTVFILTKAHDQTLIGKTREMIDWLLSSDRDALYTV